MTNDADGAEAISASPSSVTAPMQPPDASPGVGGPGEAAGANPDSGPATAHSPGADAIPARNLVATWSGKKYNIAADGTWSIGDLKRKLFDLTQVEPKRQKILGLVKGKPPEDSALLSTLTLLKPDGSFMMMGTVEEAIQREIELLEQADDIVNDLDFTYSAADTGAFHKNPKNIEKLQKAAESTSIHLINPPLRPNTRLLVLDIDYTVFDCKSSAGNITELMRPGVHSFLKAVYPYYEICFWSQTSWRWLEAKITEMGFLHSSDYKVAFVLDRTCMFSIESARGQHQVKALEIIWSKLKQYNASNTIHIDDLARNFAMNPQSGLKISAFKNGPSPASRADRELFHLTKYLLRIAHSSVTDFTKLDHKKWRDFDGPFPDDFAERLGDP